MARRQVTVFWGDAILTVLVTDRVPHFEPPLTYQVDSLDDVEPLPKPPRRAWIKSTTLLSAIAHLIVLAILAAVPAMSPKDEERERVSKMQGYLGRIAEHDAELPGDVAMHEHLQEGSFGDAFDSAGRAIDTHTASLAPLVFEPTGGIQSATKAGTPSTLGPKLARSPRSRGGSGTAGGGSNCVAFANSAAHDSKNNTWIEFVLEDGAGRPVPNERYRVTLPDGSVHEGLTDKRGLVCFTGIKGGDAKIEFPDVATEYKGSSPRPI